MTPTPTRCQARTPTNPDPEGPIQGSITPNPNNFAAYGPEKPEGQRLLPPPGVFHGNIWVIRYLPLYLVGHAL
jgi:hypothetical protein